MLQLGESDAGLWEQLVPVTDDLRDLLNECLCEDSEEASDAEMVMAALKAAAMETQVETSSPAEEQTEKPLPPLAEGPSPMIPN